MFASAYKSAMNFTHPSVISYQTPERKCGSSIGAYVVLNDEGWVLTAAHILDGLQKMRIAKDDYEVFQAERQAVLDSGRSSREKKTLIRKLARGKKFLRGFSQWWGQDDIELVDARAIPLVDLALARLEPFDPSWVAQYPTIKDPTRGLDPGTSLCRLGYPFHEIKPTYDEERGVFILPEGSVPPPLFPLEGIYTRTVTIDGAPANPYPLAFLETSSPGLRGQSGGPIFDVRGTVWAIQSRTKHYELGFQPKARDGTKKVVEHQFLSVGWGVHPVTICGFLDDQGINYQKSDY